MAARRHGSGRRSQHQEPLYDTNVATPAHAERALTLVASITTGTLCTNAHEPKGHPYGSFVTYALDETSPVFLISALAEHTKNLNGDKRCSLLAAELGEGDPLARGRVTMMGVAEKLAKGEPSKQAREAYLKTHPSASYYVDFDDFCFWRMSIQSIRYIGGYGRMSWVETQDWQAAEPDPIAPHAQAIIDHMNEDHADTMALYCRAFSKATEAETVVMSGVDRYGFEMSVTTDKGPRPVRLAFPTQVKTPNEVRVELVGLAKKARASLT